MREMRLHPLALFLCLTIPATLPVRPQAPDTEESRTDFQSLWAEAMALIEQGEYEKALPKVARVAQANPDNAYVARVMGYVLTETGRDEDAVVILRRAVTLNPHDPAAHYYLGQSLVFSGSTEAGLERLALVRREFPDSPFAEAAGSLLAQVEAAGAPSPPDPSTGETSLWEIAVQGGMKYDDNVPARSEADPTPGARDSLVWTGSLFVDRDLWTSGGTDGLPLVWEAGGGVYASYHEREEFRAFDVTSASVRTSLEDRFPMGNNVVQTGVGASANRVWLDGESYSEEAGLDLNLDAQLSDRFVLALGAEGRKVEFENDSDFPDFFSRDGWYHEYSLGGMYYPGPAWLGSMGLTYTFSIADTDGSDYESETHGADGFVYLYLPAGFGLMGSGSYRSEEFIDFIPEPERLDEVWTWTATLSHGLGVDGLTGRLSWTRTQSDSNQEFTDYERDVYDLSLTWTF